MTTLARWDPFATLDRFSRDVDTIFGDVVRRSGTPTAFFRPAVEVSRDDDPGARPRGALRLVPP